MHAPGVDELHRARARIGPHLHRTPVEHSTRLGREIGAELFLKCENLQKTGSFKPRGMLNKLLQLAPEERERGVVTISAGNAAQALAWASAVASVPSTVVMPAKASPIKAAASAGYGAEVVRHGTAAEAFEKARELERERHLTFIHPFDDPHIVAGTASAGLELLEQVDDASVVVVPVGGGGLISGVASAVKQLRPEIRVFGVEPKGAATMHASLAAGRAVHEDGVTSVADGLAPPMAGELNYHIVSELVEDVVLVDDDEILMALAAVLGAAKLLVEPSGAAGVAALRAGRIPLDPSDRVVAMLSGGNVSVQDLPRLLPSQEG